MRATIKTTLALLATLGLGCGGMETEYAAAGVIEPGVTCSPPDPEVGRTSLTLDGTGTYWTECWSCDDGTKLERTWGPHPRDWQTGPALTTGTSVDVPGGCE